MKRSIPKVWRLEVQWVDSSSINAGWTPVRTHLKHRRPILVSVGFVLADDKKSVVLANSLDPANGNALGVVSIPTEAIVSRRRLR